MCSLCRPQPLKALHSVCLYRKWLPGFIWQCMKSIVFCLCYSAGLPGQQQNPRSPYLISFSIIKCTCHITELHSAFVSAFPLCSDAALKSPLTLVSATRCSIRTDFLPHCGEPPPPAPIPRAFRLHLTFTGLQVLWISSLTCSSA